MKVNSDKASSAIAEALFKCDIEHLSRCVSRLKKSADPEAAAETLGKVFNKYAAHYGLIVEDVSPEQLEAEEQLQKDAQLEQAIINNDLHRAVTGAALVALAEAAAPAPAAAGGPVVNTGNVVTDIQQSVAEGVAAVAAGIQPGRVTTDNVEVTQQDVAALQQRLNTTVDASNTTGEFVEEAPAAAQQPAAAVSEQPSAPEDQDEWTQ